MQLFAVFENMSWSEYLICMQSILGEEKVLGPDCLIEY
ncbi:hypothetical protein APHNP_1766 [Anaplasma phagocytophilum str. ApNP]|uniref:Uncharacterized protein n=1 Tax=Anaplasma phagocytophilum str. ApNP TaxID=1359153 RepID=A0A0F3NFG8_ANAPH|nr:hypothetical protein APHNP_1766 [Anaplasma phagocytophilum str. ApNP]